MGEKSKKRGEHGEKIVASLLDLVGWKNLLKGRDIPCHTPIEHSKSTKARSTHGIDFIYQYDCPLFNDVQEFLLISSKFGDKYPSNPNNKFGTYIEDLATALYCFQKSTIRNELKRPNKTAKYTGVIIWLENGKSEYQDAIERLSDFRIPNLEFDSIYLVDSRRADFIDKTINYAKNQFSSARLEFYVHSTGLNNSIQGRKTSTNALPVQYINSSVLPFKIIQGKSEILMLNVIDQFSEEYLMRLIGLAQKLTEGWANEIRILFPQFNDDIHGEAVENIKLGFRDQTFVQKVVVDTFAQDFRNV